MYLILGQFRDGLNREQKVPIADSEEPAGANF